MILAEPFEDHFFGHTSKVGRKLLENFHSFLFCGRLSRFAQVLFKLSENLGKQILVLKSFFKLRKVARRLKSDDGWLVLHECLLLPCSLLHQRSLHLSLILLPLDFLDRLIVGLTEHNIQIVARKNFSIHQMLMCLEQDIHVMSSEELIVTDVNDGISKHPLRQLLILRVRNLLENNIECSVKRVESLLSEIETNPKYCVLLCLEGPSELIVFMVTEFNLRHINAANRYLNFTALLSIPVENSNTLIEA